MITVKELTKKYARNTAVDHISFEIQKGQIVGFLGPERRRQNHHDADADVFHAADGRDGDGGRLRCA